MLLRSGVNVTRLRRRAKPLALLVLLVYGLYSLLTLNLRVNQRLVRKDDSVPAEGSVGQSNHGQAPQPPLVSLPLQEIHRDLVVASTKSDNTSWLYEHFPDWHKSIYVVDDANAELTVEMNKGRESMVYLTYALPHHSSREQAIHVDNQSSATDDMALPATSLTTTTTCPMSCSSSTPSATNGTTMTRTTMAFP